MSIFLLGLKAKHFYGPENVPLYPVLLQVPYAVYQSTLHGLKRLITLFGSLKQTITSRHVSAYPHYP